MFINKIKNERGQAFFELIIFLPFLIFLYTIFYTVGNSINGSINQQKAVRGYFYQLLKGNSYITSAVDLDGYGGSITSVGFFALGWNEKLEGGRIPIAPCFAFTSMLRNGSSEDCESPARPIPDASSFVRVFTMYGICGPVFSVPSSTTSGRSFVIEQTSQVGACTLQ